jgi:preprotein translocase subunit YajC
MDMNCLAVILAMAPQAPVPGQPAPNPLFQLVPMVLIVVVFYFILIRPQQKKAKEQARLLKNLKSGDKVATASGIIGIVISVKDNTVSLRSADSKLEMTKDSVTAILNSEPSAS